LSGLLIYESKNIRLRLFQELTESKFVSSWFRIYSQKYFNQNAQQTVGMASINQEQIGLMPIPLPPLNEQKRIVAAIEALRERSQKARSALSAIPELCDKFRQSVLAAAFRGDLTADWREQNPDVEPASALLERIRRDRQQKYLKEVEELKSEGKNHPKLPDFESIATDLVIPETWISISVESACLFIIDCLHSTPKFVEEGEYCIDTTCIEPFKISWHKARRVSPDDFILRTSRMIPKQNDILFSREGTIGTTVRVPGSPKLCLGQRMIMFRFAPSILPEYAELFLQSPIFKNQYKPLILGTTSPHLNIGNIRKLDFLVPSVSEQRQIVNAVTSFLDTAFDVEQQYQGSGNLLDWLDRSILAKAFRGELVEQDPNDEPASVLLERIRADREQQMQGKIKKPGKKKRTGD